LAELGCVGVSDYKLSKLIVNKLSLLKCRDVV